MLKLEKTTRKRLENTFSACNFCFLIYGHVTQENSFFQMLSHPKAGVFLLLLCIDKKENFLENITRSEMGNKNIQAEKVSVQCRLCPRRFW